MEGGREEREREGGNGQIVSSCVVLNLGVEVVGVAELVRCNLKVTQLRPSNTAALSNLPLSTSCQLTS